MADHRRPEPSWPELEEVIFYLFDLLVDRLPHLMADHDERLLDRFQHRVYRQVRKIMSNQDKLDQDVNAIGTAFAAAIQELKDQIAAGSQPEDLDFSKADALVASVQAEATADAPVTPEPTPAPDPTPEPDPEPEPTPAPDNPDAA